MQIRIYIGCIDEHNQVITNIGDTTKYLLQKNLIREDAFANPLYLLFFSNKVSIAWKSSYKGNKGEIIPLL